MGRRSGARDEPIKAQRRKAQALKRRRGPKVQRRVFSAASLEATVARLTDELKEALERQQATAEVLSAISRSKFELQPILQSVVDTAAQLCRADAAVIFRLEAGIYRFAAGYSLDPMYLDHERQTPISPGPGTVIGRAAMSRQVVQIEDALTDPLYEQKGAIKKAGGHSMMGVPLMRASEPIGVIGLARNRVDPFTQREIELVTTFADQAVIAIENARLFEAEQQRTRELSESLEQQTATSEVLQVISGSPGKLEPVFATMLEKAVRICDAGFGSMALREGDGFRRVCMHNAPPQFVQFHEKEPLFDATVSRSVSQVVATKQVLHIADLRVTDPTSRLAKYAGALTLLNVPLLKEKELVGIMGIYRQEVRPFTDKQIKLVQNFAAQAVIAIENAQLLNELRRRTTDLTESLEQQTATSEVLRVIGGSPGDLTPVFNAILTNAVRICGAKLGNLFVREGDFFRIAATHGAPQAYLDYLHRERVFRADPRVGIGVLMRTKRTYHVADLRLEPTYDERLRMATIELAAARSLIGVPMLKEGEVNGCIAIYRQEVRPFTDKQIELVENFAKQAVIAIENARLLNELRQRTTDLTVSLEQQTATANVLRVIAGSPTAIEPVLEVIVRTAGELCQSEYAILFRLRDGKYYMAWSNNAEPDWVEYWSERPITPDRGSLLGRTVLELRAVQILDCLNDPEYTQHEATRLGRQRSMLGVPLLRDGIPIGAIVLIRTVVKPFTEKQIELVTAFADQAVIAIENTRLLSELRQRTTDLTESLEQQTATANVLEVISRSALDLQGVFQTVVDSSVRLCGADRAFIFRFDGELLRMTAGSNVSAEFREWVAQHPIRPGRHSAAARAALERKTIHIPDVLADPEYTYGAKVIETVRTILAVPILKGDDLLGAIMVYRLEMRPFTEQQMVLVQTFADQAAIAIENGRLLDALRLRTADLGRSVDELRALGEVSQAVNSTLDLETVLSTIVAKAVQLSGTEAGAIYVYDDLGRQFHLRATYGMDQELIDALTRQQIDVRDSNVAAVVTEGEPIQVADLREVAMPASIPIRHCGTLASRAAIRLRETFSRKTIAP
jgi:GAF domain-containing protein